ncbi:type II secretion system protein [Candidatus Peregrinibacteria bacterium]|nr:type II secretion system protein [Candidatus Peregrinibacteria bacterium]
MTYHYKNPETRRKSVHAHRAFTLIEALIAVSIFTVAALIGTRILIDVVQSEKIDAAQNPLYQDARLILQTIANEVQSGAIDYEEYYNMNVIQADSLSRFYGINYGVYASRFYDPGRRLDGNQATNPDDLGIECSVFEDPPTNSKCEIYFTHSSDTTTGQHPYDASTAIGQAEANAICDHGIGHCLDTEMDELYLLDSSGARKTIIARKKIAEEDADGDWAVGLMRLEGRDLDQNGVVDIFSCKSEFECSYDPTVIFNMIKYPFVQDQGATDGQSYIADNEIRLAEQGNLDDIFDINTSQFLPISPLGVDVKELKFIISPLEDPYKAFAERDLQVHPAVTIILKLGLAESTSSDYPGRFADVTVQDTVSVGVLGEIQSYPPVTDLLRTTDTSWIKTVLPGGL